MADTEFEPLHRRVFHALAGPTVCFLGEYAFRLFLLLLREAWQADQPQGTFAIPLCGFVILLALGNRQLSSDACNRGPRLLPEFPLLPLIFSGFFLIFRLLLGLPLDSLRNRQLSSRRLLPDLPHPADLLRLFPDLPASS